MSFSLLLWGCPLLAVLECLTHTEIGQQKKVGRIFYRELKNIEKKRGEKRGISFSFFPLPFLTFPFFLSPSFSALPLFFLGLSFKRALGKVSGHRAESASRKRPIPCQHLQIFNALL
jgi:hypothetical protein